MVQSVQQMSAVTETTAQQSAEAANSAQQAGEEANVGGDIMRHTVFSLTMHNRRFNARAAQ